MKGRLSSWLRRQWHGDARPAQRVYDPDDTLPRRDEIIGKPDGWTPESELDHFMVCPGCGETIDCRDLGQVMEHLHGQEPQFVERKLS